MSFLLACLTAGLFPAVIRLAGFPPILASVYDIRNMRHKLRREEGHKRNSPWNVSARFPVDMSFSAVEIAGMLNEYETDCGTGMDVGMIADLIYTYTSGYPYLVSALCKYIDEELFRGQDVSDSGAAWTKAGVLEAVKHLICEKNPLFESLIEKLNDYSEMREMIYLLLFRGQTIAYNADDNAMDILLMFGFIRVEHETIQMANRIFETRLYNYFLTLPAVQNGEMYRLQNKRDRSERNQAWR